jgi:IMP dehydrogenase
MNDAIPLGLSFDDVLLVPQLSEVLPSETDIGTTLASGLRLNIPVISSAMDTVTEAELAMCDRDIMVSFAGEVLQGQSGRIILSQ